MTDTLMALARTTQQRLLTRVGNSERERHIILQCALAGEVLNRQGGTIDFDASSEDVKRKGIRTIWEYIAFLYPCDSGMRLLVDPSDRERWLSVEENAVVYRHGFTSLRQKILEHWRQNLYLYMVPRRREKSLIEVITINPDYLVNTVDTAKDLVILRTDKQAQSVLQSSLERMEAVMGDRSTAANRLNLFLTDLSARPTKKPRLDPAQMQLFGTDE